MFRQHDLLPGEAYGRPVHLWRFGHFGAPVIVFPSAGGMAHEWDAHGLVDALADLIDGGRIKLYCTESNVAEAWTRKDGDPAWRMARHAAFERYVLEELVPFVRDDCRSPTIPVAAAGTSLGATYAANFALKHPETFRSALCMSGRYDLTEFVPGYGGADLYFNSPLAYVPNLDGAALDRVRDHTCLTVVCGRGRWEDGNIEEAEALGRILAAKDIPHELDMWGFDVDHGWEWWRRQARLHLGRMFGD